VVHDVPELCIRLPSLPSSLGLMGAATASAELEAIALRENRFLCPVAATIGLEARLAWMMSHDASLLALPDPLGPSSARDLHNTEHLRRIFLRPSAEAVIGSWWSLLCSDRLIWEDCVRIVSAMNGIPVFESDKFGRTKGGDGYAAVTFCRDVEAIEMPNFIAENGKYFSNCIDRASFVYAAVIVNHPLSDGNGRLARILMCRELARSGVIKSPCVPLSPIMYRNMSHVYCAVRDLSETGDWHKYLDEMRSIIELGLDASFRFVAPVHL